MYYSGCDASNVILVKYSLTLSAASNTLRIVGEIRSRTHVDRFDDAAQLRK